LLQGGNKWDKADQPHEGATLKWMGKWDEHSEYKAGDLVRDFIGSSASDIYLAIRANSGTFRPRDDTDAANFRGDVRNWTAFSHYHLCSALSFGLALKIADPEPIGRYQMLLNAVLHQDSVDAQVNKLSGSP
jgi:hypothetical protein